MLTWQRQLRDFDVEMRGVWRFAFACASLDLSIAARTCSRSCALEKSALHFRILASIVESCSAWSLCICASWSACSARRALSPPPPHHPAYAKIEGAGNGRTTACGVPAKVSKAVCGEIEGAKRRITPGKTHGESDSKVSSDSCKEGKE